MTGKQEPGGMWDKDIDYNRGGEMDMNENSTMKERANLCKFLREEKGVFGKGGSWTVYELFNAPNISICA